MGGKARDRRWRWVTMEKVHHHGEVEIWPTIIKPKTVRGVFQQGKWAAGAGFVEANMFTALFGIEMKPGDCRKVFFLKMPSMEDVADE